MLSCHFYLEKIWLVEINVFTQLIARTAQKCMNCAFSLEVILTACANHPSYNFTCFCAVLWSVMICVLRSRVQKFPA